MQVGILGNDCEYLCDAELQPGEADELIIRPAPGSGSALFTYYFFRSGRCVTLDLGEVRLPATLRTRWRDGERVWWVEPLQVPPGEPTDRDTRPAAGPPPPRRLTLAQLS